MTGSRDVNASLADQPAAPEFKQSLTSTFPSLKQVTAGVLTIGYGELGPPDGNPVLLLHGWPYDIHSYAEVAPLLAARGCRVIVPYLRGHGPTRFLKSETPRSGQQAAIGADVIALMDALKIPRAVLAGYDWGGACRLRGCRPLARAMHRVGIGQQLSDSGHC
ncbi:alpha/beta fold hydrolase [Larkinella insperata]|uniref:Alpha/beta fold hydrolase n=1 Tax=Larkinella insperata TaxID=332158 RepID=A0ABW3Q603_9BACT